MAPGPLGGCLALASPTATSPRRKATFMVEDSVQILVDGRLGLILQAGLETPFIRISLAANFDLKIKLTRILALRVLF